jgi:hypothetical protein
MITEDLRVRLAQSMPAIGRRRAAIVADLQFRMVPTDRSGQGPAPDLIAATLLELLIQGGSDMAAFGALRSLAEVRKQHAKLGISGRHQSRFGLALGPALRHVLGLSISPESAAAWCDTFWLLVRALERDGPEPPIDQDQIVQVTPNTARTLVY